MRNAAEEPHRYFEIHKPLETADPWIKYCYRRWRASARQRGIECQMTLEEWWGAWAPHWAEREALHLVMCRYGDRGPLAVDNIYFAPQLEHARDRRVHRNSVGQFQQRRRRPVDGLGITSAAHVDNPGDGFSATRIDSS
jgi:hypothetical protein